MGHSGFAYLSGNIDEHFLEDIYELMLDRTKSNPKRLLLMTRDKYVQEFFESKDDVIEEKRYLFQYSGAKRYMESSLPDGYELKEIDIGIETKPEYKQQGLGMIVVNKMIQYTIKQAKEPVWACHYKNAASEKMAEKLGFIKVFECSVIKSKY